MLHNTNFEMEDPADNRLAHWRAPETGNRLDCETGVLLCRKLLPIFESATNWQELHQMLEHDGFGLGFRAGRLMLTDISNGDYICSCRFLGSPLKTLSDKFGKPRARQQTQCGNGKLVG